MVDRQATMSWKIQVGTEPISPAERMESQMDCPSPLVLELTEHSGCRSLDSSTTRNQMFSQAATDLTLVFVELVVETTIHCWDKLELPLLIASATQLDAMVSQQAMANVGQQSYFV